MDSSAWTLLLPLSTILVFLLTSIYYLCFSSTSIKRHQLGRWPPSTPYAVPLLGDYLWLRKSPLELATRLRRLRELGIPVVTLKYGISPTVFVLDRALIHEALIQQGAAFADRPPSRGAFALLTNNGHSVSDGNGPVWRSLRRNLTTEVLRPTRIRAFAEERKWVLGRMLADLKEEVACANGSGVVLAVADRFRQAMFQILLFVCFGERVDNTTIEVISRVEGDLVSLHDSLAVFNVLPGIGKVLFWRRWRKVLDIRNRRREIMMPLIAAARDRTRQQQQGFFPYVDSLLNLELQEEGSSGGRKLTDDEIISLCFEFLEAGIDTMETTLEWVMANLVKYPHTQNRLAEEIAAVGALASQSPDTKEPGTVDSDYGEGDLLRMPYLKAVIHETLRRHPPGPFLLPHVAVQDVTLGGGKWTVPKGATVHFAAAEIGWDSAVWKDPLQFRPERFLEGGEADGVDLTGSRGIKMIPFGAGRRICPGIGFGILHLEDFVAGFIREFEWHPETEGGEVDLSEKQEFTLKMKNSLRARIYKRSAVN